MKNKKIIIASIVVVILGALAFYQYSQKTKINSSSKDKEETTQSASTENSGESVINEGTIEDEHIIVYFYGAECSHCKDVELYLNENDVYSKVKFTKKEVWHNKKNGEELRNAALKCGKNPSTIGVPFVFNEGKCYMGGPEVMSFFAKKAGIKK